MRIIILVTVSLVADCNLQTHFQCGNETSCLLLEKRCDGKIDCWDAADEINCTLGKIRATILVPLLFVSRETSLIRQLSTRRYTVGDWLTNSSDCESGSKRKRLCRTVNTYLNNELTSRRLPSMDG